MKRELTPRRRRRQSSGCVGEAITRFSNITMREQNNHWLSKNRKTNGWVVYYELDDSNNFEWERKLLRERIIVRTKVYGV